MMTSENTMRNCLCAAGIGAVLGVVGTGVEDCVTRRSGPIDYFQATHAYDSFMNTHETARAFRATGSDELRTHPDVVRAIELNQEIERTRWVHFKFNKLAQNVPLGIVGAVVLYGLGSYALSTRRRYLGYSL